MPQDYDSAYKAFYERLFQGWNIPIETQVEVSRRTWSIDAVIRCQEVHLQRLQGTAFEFFLLINDLELKGPEDALDRADYMRTVSRAYGLLAKQRTEAYGLPRNATLTIVCSVRPDTILDRLQSEFGFVPTDEPGVYISDQELQRRIIVATELDVIPKNYPLLILSKGPKLLEFFEEVVNKGLTEYVEILFQVAVDIDPETLTEGVIKMAEMHPEYKANLERAVAKWLTFSPESAQRIAPLQQLLEEEKRNAKQEDLSLLLESKFGSLSKELTSKLEAISDVDELTELYKRALHAQTLEEIGL